MKRFRPHARHVRLLLAVLLPIALSALLAVLATSAYPAAAATGAVVTPVVYLPAIFKPWPSCGATPCLLSPQNGSKITTLTPLFVWDAGPAPEDGYWTEFSQFSPDPGLIFYCRFGCRYPGSGVVSVHGTGWLWADWYRSDGNLQPGTTYTWSVRRCDSAVQCDESELWTFTTPDDVKLPPPPAAITPTSGTTVTGQLVNLEWSPVDGALAYEFCLSYVGSPPYSRNCGWVETTALTVNLAANLQYYWRVAALGPGGQGPGVLASIRVTGAPASAPLSGPAVEKRANVPVPRR